MLRELLARGGLAPNYPVDAVTLLHALCHKDSRGRTMDHRTECAAIRLEFGADPSPKDTHGETPVMWATKHALTDRLVGVPGVGLASSPSDSNW
jgi:hypothetical protein